MQPILAAHHCCCGSRAMAHTLSRPPIEPRSELSNKTLPVTLKLPAAGRSMASQRVRATPAVSAEGDACRRRIQAAGGSVELVHCWRVMRPASKGVPASGLAVSRALGDLQFKQPLR